METPFLSIIIPIYNAEKYLHQCVDSVITQNFEDYELWLIDDGSSDSSIEIIKQYARADSRIKTAFIKGSGPAIPRNYGMRRAIGKYILFIDSDDYLPTGALAELVKAAKRFKEADFIRGNQRILVGGVREARSIFAERRAQYANQIVDAETFMVDVLDKDYAPIDSLIRLKFLKDNAIEFHEELVILEDGPFIVDICSAKAKCVYINDETYVYRLGNELSVTNSPKSFPKCKSLVRGAEYSFEQKESFSEKGYNHILNRSVEHAVSACFQSAFYLDSKEAKRILKDVRAIWPKMPNVGRSGKHAAFIRIYNLSPYLAYMGLRLLKSLKFKL